MTCLDTSIVIVYMLVDLVVAHCLQTLLAILTMNLWKQYSVPLYFFLSINAAAHMRTWRRMRSPVPGSRVAQAPTPATPRAVNTHRLQQGDWVQSCGLHCTHTRQAVDHGIGRATSIILW